MKVFVDHWADSMWCPRNGRSSTWTESAGFKLDPSGLGKRDPGLPKTRTRHDDPYYCMFDLVETQGTS